MASTTAANRSHARATSKRKATRKKPVARSPKWMPAFLVALRDTANVRAACEAAKVTHPVVYTRRQKDPAFEQAWEVALQEATDLLETEARRRAYEGVDEPVIHQGQLQGYWVDADGNAVAKDTPKSKLIPLTVKRYSDNLLIFLLKAHRPEKFRERHDHTISGGSGKPIKVAKTNDPDQYRSLVEGLLAVQKEASDTSGQS